MKKKIVSLLLIICMLLPTFAACGNDGGDNSDGSGNPDANSGAVGDNYIFTSGSSVTLLVSRSESEGEQAQEYNSLIYDMDMALATSPASLSVKKNDDTGAKATHEIMVGPCDRELSRQAYRALEKLDTDDKNHTGYVIYSNGDSVAIAYKTDDEYITPKAAVDYFIDNYVTSKSACVMKVGQEYSKTFSLIDYYQQRDDATVSAQWQSLKSNIVSAMTPSMGKTEALAYAEDMIDAFKEFYSMYDDKLISWLANQLEPSMCICDGECQKTKFCGGAGFYYSNSARDTVGFLPDSESTAQAIGIIANSGMLDLVDGDVSKAFTKKNVAGFIRFCKALQDAESGYFYHPQWNKDELSASRRARDMSYACSVLTSFGSSPTYNAPNGVEGDGILYDGTSVQDSVAPASKLLTPKLSDSKPVAVSSVVASATAAYPSYMENDVTYKAYLASLDLKGNSYSVGNTLASTATQLINRQKQLTSKGVSYNLIDITDQWFRANQNKENGTWYFVEPTANNYDPYYGNDGVLKISAWYNDVGREFPNPSLAAENAIDAIVCDVDIDHVCNLYNTWFTISNLKLNVRKYGSSHVADNFISDLRKIAPDGVRKSYEKISDHQKEDGSFSYFRNHCSQTSQGMPVAIECDEGDMNATSIATYGIVGFMFSALDFGEYPSLYTDADRRVFLDIVTELDAVIKNSEIDPEVPETFDNFNIGDGVSGSQFAVANSNPATAENPNGTSLVVVDDIRSGHDGNVLRYHSASKIDSTDWISLMSTTGLGGNTWVFSAELCLEEFEEKVTNPGIKNTPGDAIYINMGNGLPEGNIYMLALRVREENGKRIVGIWDVSSTSVNAAVSGHIADVEMSEWFKLKVEYYRMKVDDEERMRAKIYLNDKLIYVSDNYFDLLGTKITGNSSPTTTFNRVWISTVGENLTTLLIDEFAVYKFRKNYTVESLPIEVNVDGVGNDKTIYDFTDGKLHTDLESTGAVNTASTKAVITEGSSLFVPANIRSIRYNRGSLEADIAVSGTSGVAGYIRFVDNTFMRDGIISIAFKIENNEVRLYDMQDGVIGSAIEGASFPVGVSVKLRVDFFHGEDKTLIYINGDFINQSEAKFGTVNKLTYGGAYIEAGENYTITVDNLVADFDTCSFIEAPGVRINIPEASESFDEGVGNASLSGGATLTSGAVSLSKEGAAVHLSPSIRSEIGQCYIASFTVSLSDPSIVGDLARLAITDKNGGVIFALVLSADEAKFNLYECGAGGKYPLAVASADKSGSINIKIEYYTDSRMANIYLNNIGITASGIFFDERSDSLVYELCEIKALAYGVLLEDITADVVYRPYASVASEGDTNLENAKETVSFDYALDSNLPSAITGSLYKTWGAGVQIKQMLKNINGKSEYSKVARFSMSAGGNDEFRFVSSASKMALKNATCVVFEGEFCVESEYNGTLWQVIFGDSAKGITQDAAYAFGISAGSNGITLYEISSANGSYSRGGTSKVLAQRGEWFKLRVEYYAGDDDTVRIKIFLNDELLLVSDNYYRDYNKAGYPKNYFNQVNFYGQSKSHGVLNVDNVTFSIVDGATCTDSVTETYSYGSGVLDQYKR